MQAKSSCVAAAEPAPLPPRSERVRSLRRLLGEPDPAVRQLALGIRATAHHHFDRHVLPLVATHWPALSEATPARGSFMQKLRIGACDLYASAPYTALLCAPRRPALIRAVTTGGNWIPLPAAVLALCGRGAVELLGRVAYADVHRRIALVAAFIVVVDHVLDHVMDDAPAARGERLLGVIDGRIPADGPELSLVRALRESMGEGLDAGERKTFEAAMARVREWIRAEVRAMLGAPDPRGLGHRLAGVEGTIDGLLFPVARFGAEAARAWMLDVSMFVQLMDDWLDYEQDKASNRPTPVTTGDWTFADVEAGWRSTASGIEALVRTAGLSSPHYVRFVREAYVLMIADVFEAMAARPDA